MRATIKRASKKVGARMNRVVAVVSIFAIVAAAWLHRWSDPVPFAEDSVMVIDRFTGSVWVYVAGASGGGKYRIELDFTEDLRSK